MQMNQMGEKESKIAEFRSKVDQLVESIFPLIEDPIREFVWSTIKHPGKEGYEYLTDLMRKKLSICVIASMTSTPEFEAKFKAQPKNDNSKFPELKCASAYMDEVIELFKYEENVQRLSEVENMLGLKNDQ